MGRDTRRSAALVAAAVAALALTVGTTPAATGRTERPQPAAATTPVAKTDPALNPLAGRPWGVYEGASELSWAPYTQAHGHRKKLLGKIALAPKAKWFGSWISNAQIAKKVQQYIASAQAGNPSTLVQMTIFRVKPWEHDACSRLPSASDIASYKDWIDRFASAIGSTPMAIVLQPDGPFALCAPGGNPVYSSLVGYAATELSSLPATSVYIDAGASDWDADNPAKALAILLPAGIAVARGFALNSTHYVSTSNEVEFGTAVVHALEAAGVPGKHFVVNTAANGQPFDGSQYHGPNFDNAATCRSKTQHLCVTLGIPPTADVANPAWGLAPQVAADAAAYADGYVWVGRPWLDNQADPFDLKRALAVAKTTPYRARCSCAARRRSAIR